MNILQVSLTLLLFIFMCDTSSCLKTDRSELLFNNGPNISRRSRRIGLNEYLVPPPISKSHSLRTGRVTNSSPTEPSGYLSQLMNWLNPFNYDSSTSVPLKSPPHIEVSYPSSSQSYGSTTFNLHSALQLDPPPLSPPYPPFGSQTGSLLHPPIGLQTGPSLHFPISSSVPQHSAHLLHTASSIPHLGLSHSSPPGPSLQFYNFNVPSNNFLDKQRAQKDHRTIYISTNKGKQCNPCNKVPWIPMQSGSHSDNYPLPPSPVHLSNSYLPPSNQANHDIQFAASHEIKIPEISQAPVDQNPFNNPLLNPQLYSAPMPPLYETKPFDRPSQNPSEIENFKSPPLPEILLDGQEYKSSEINDERYNIHNNNDVKSIGTEINKGISQNQNEVNKRLTDHKESYDSFILNTQSSISGPFFDQGYSNNPSILNQENGEILNQPMSHVQNTINSFGSNLKNHEFSNQNDYQELFKSNPIPNTDLNYLPPDLNPSASFGTSTFYQDAGNLNYSDDLSPSGSVVKDSHITTQTPKTSFALKEESIHYEESPLLDLTKNGESRTDMQWPTSTNGYNNIDDVSNNTVKTTTDYSLETDNIYFENSSSFVKPTDSYTSSDIQSINNIFGASTTTTEVFLNHNKNQDVEISTITTQYTNQQDVSPSGQPGYLWPSLSMNTSNDSSRNQVFLNHLAKSNNTFLEIKNFWKQNSVNLKNAKDMFQKQQNMKRNKQVQVIIPYTSEYTPIPFQQSYGDWSVKTNFNRTQSRKILPQSELNDDNYLQQEYRNEIRAVNHFQSQFNFNNSNKLNMQSLRPEDSRSITRANTSIDVRRLQKNIDNWTIQEYSKPTTFSTILPSSLHPYLSPSKKIPTEYLTTTEPGDHGNQLKDHNESVKTYSLAGFSFNEVEHEGSASNYIEETQPSMKIERISNPKTSNMHSVNKSAIEEKSTWESHSVSISPVNKERIYVVTPLPMPEVPSKNGLKKEQRKEKQKNLQRSSEPIINDTSNNKNNLNEFEAIEKAYQVLPQAVNNLAVASTGKENIPLWGIMEHEEFASLNPDENDEETEQDVADGPVLYSGHSKVSRAKR